MFYEKPPSKLLHQTTTCALALGHWSFAHGLAMLLLDGRVHEELSNDGDASVRRIAAALTGELESSLVDR